MANLLVPSGERILLLTAQLQLGRRLDLLPFVGDEALVHAGVLLLHLFDDQSRGIGEDLVRIVKNIY